MADFYENPYTGQITGYRPEEHYRAMKKYNQNVIKNTVAEIDNRPEPEPISPSDIQNAASADAAIYGGWGTAGTISPIQQAANQDIVGYGPQMPHWGGGGFGPQMTPFMNAFSPGYNIGLPNMFGLGEFDWGGFLNTYGGK